MNAHRFVAWPLILSTLAACGGSYGRPMTFSEVAHAGVPEQAMVILRSGPTRVVRGGAIKADTLYGYVDENDVTEFVRIPSDSIGAIQSYEDGGSAGWIFGVAAGALVIVPVALAVSGGGSWDFPSDFGRGLGSDRE